MAALQEVHWRSRVLVQQWIRLPCQATQYTCQHVVSCFWVCHIALAKSPLCTQADLERDTETLKKEVVDIRLLAQRDIVLDPQAEMLEVSRLQHIA